MIVFAAIYSVALLVALGLFAGPMTAVWALVASLLISLWLDLHFHA